MMQRRPILVLLLLMACSALVQVVAAPARPLHPRTNNPAKDGYTCTACGPIPSGACPVKVELPASSQPDSP